MSTLRKFVVALFVVFLHYSSQIASRSAEQNRYWDQWGLADVVAILLGMTLLAFVALGMDLLVLRLSSDTLKRLFNHLFLVALTSGVLAASPRFTRDCPNVTALIWMGAMAVIGYSFGRRETRLVRYAANFCLVFSPAVIIVSAPMFTWSTWNQPAEHLPAVDTKDGSGTPVFVFVFDGWSYQRTMDGGQLRPSFGNLRRLCEESILFREARSPYHSTELSLPRLIFQTDRQFVTRHGEVHCEDGEASVPARTLPSLFQLGRQHGYTSYVLGFRIPYRHILGDQVDYCWVCGGAMQDFQLPGKLLTRFAENVQYFSDPVSQREWIPLSAWIIGRRRHQQFQAYQEQMNAILERSRKPTFALLHMPLPHEPFVFQPDGSYYGPVARMDVPEDYRRQLKYLDAVIGQIVQELRANGDFDKSLIVMTSDHSWRSDPDPTLRDDPDWRRRVPLIIKLPGQKSGLIVDDELCTNQLKPLFESVFSGQRDPQRLMALIRGISGPSHESVVPAPAE